MGKTTITKTICQLIDSTMVYGVSEKAESERFSLVSFFCSRQLDSGKSSFLLPTICRQLCDHSASYATSLVAALEQDSTLASATLKIQLEQLLIKPWEAGASEQQGLPWLIVIIDALDENPGGFIFFEGLLEAVKAKRLGGLKFFISSRMDPNMTALCATFPPDTVCYLQDISKESTQNDIRCYLKEVLPPDIDTLLVEKLTKASNGLFIYAATVVKLVCGQDSNTVEEQEIILEEIFEETSDSGPPMDLNQLYYQIVKDAISHERLSIQTTRLNILHTILCVMHPITVPAIAKLAKTKETTVAHVISKLHPVMYQSHEGLIYIYHASFQDFILDSSFTNNASFFDLHCNAAIQHAFLSKNCFQIMAEELHFNMCGLESSYVKDKDIPDLPTYVQQKISLVLQYSMLNWTDHLALCSSPDEETINLPSVFIHKWLLYWLEAVNLLNARRKGMQALNKLRIWIHKVSSMEENSIIQTD